MHARPAPAQVHPPRPHADEATLGARYAEVRARSCALAAPLSAEDAQLQSMPDASPGKWHLAHTTWFFARFVLEEAASLPEGWDVLFNSYYVGAGERHARAQRGLLSRPSLAEVLDWREQVDDRVRHGLGTGRFDQARRQVLLMGIHHEQQHQELLLTDIKHALWCNPLGPAYRPELARTTPVPAAGDAPLHWLRRDEGIVEIGAPRWPDDDAAAFAYDNETPRHRVLLAAHAIAQRPVRNADYRDFVADGGYRTPTLWLSDGWDLVQREGWCRPLYWHEDGEREFGLGGWQPRDPQAPVCHLSHYEADAFAHWAGARLPTEPEWEAAAAACPVEGNFADADAPLHPRASPGAGAGQAPRDLFGNVWEWTSSAYGAYPGFRPLRGVLGEYNGKFMSGQLVLRGGSCATPRGHVRASYRNFFPPHARWQFSGLRLAKDLD